MPRFDLRICGTAVGSSWQQTLVFGLLLAFFLATSMARGGVFVVDEEDWGNGGSNAS